MSIPIMEQDKDDDKINKYMILLARKYAITQKYIRLLLNNVLPKINTAEELEAFMENAGLIMYASKDTRNNLQYQLSRLN